MDVVLAVQHQAGFTVDLYRAVQSNDAGSNAVMSPLSIATALAMTGAGAKGSTLTELMSVLKVPEGNAMHQFAKQVKEGILKDGSSAGGPLLSFANGLWVDKKITLKPVFQETVKESYGAEIRSADFDQKADEERKAINVWVANQTKGKIQDLLQPNSVTSSTVLVLANALYFKGTWAKQFDKADTVDKEFELLNGQKIRVPFLSSPKKQYIKAFDSYKVLKLAYAKGTDSRSFSMHIVLPNDKSGLAELEKDLDPNTLIQDLNFVRQEVPVGEFLLPKFKVSTSFSVPESLKSLGLKAPFSSGADFSDIGNGSFHISDVVHKAFIEVNEEGTEAAAATAVTMLRSFQVAEPIDFVADHPFLFILREEMTGMILFIGRVIDPSSSG